MGATAKWIEDNWFPLCQSVGIVGGLLFTAYAICRDRKARRLSDFLALNAQHSSVWSDAEKQPELQRVFAEEVDLLAKPITLVEERFLNRATMHFFTGWQFAKAGSIASFAALNPDVRWFFSLPLPKAAWERSKSTRDPAFVRYVESCLAAH